MSVIKRILLTGLLLSLTAVSFAQSKKLSAKERRAIQAEVAEAKDIWSDIKENTSTYLCGEGFGDTLEEADQNAFSDLISKISVYIESDFDQTDVEQNENGGVDSRSVVVSKVKTYSAAALTNTERIVISNEPDAYVGRYIKRSELAKIFAERLVKVKNFAEYGQRAVEANKVGDALRYYYWSLMLLQSVPHSTSTEFLTHSGETVHLATWLPLQLSEVLDGITVKFVKMTGSDAVLSFKYKDEPVAALDYTYFDGRDWSNIYTAKDGVGVIELPSDITLPKVQVRFETSYRSQAHIDKDVENVLSTQKLVAMKNAYRDVYLSGVKTPKAEVKREAKAEAARQEEVAGKLDYVKAPKNNADVMSKVVKAIKSKNYDSAKEFFTSDGYDMYTKLVHYGNAIVLDDTNIRYYNFRDKVVARDVKMSFSFAKGATKSFVEDVVFTFNADGLIECIAFGLNDEAFKCVASNTFWNELTRMCLIEFLENYKTAYSLKRLDYLESIFDDNAVIIVGHVAIRQTPQMQGDSNDVSFKDNKVVTRTRVSKDKYMKSLSNCFASNEFVNIRFADNEIRKYNTGGETYGIQIKQDYYSTNYGDTGYLFLMVDLNNPDLPVIKVRTWQENSVPTDELITINDF